MDIIWPNNERKLENAGKFVTLIRLKLGRGNLSWIGMQSCILGNPNSCLTMVGGFLKPHTLFGRKKPSLDRKLLCQNCNLAFLVIVGLLKHHGCLNTLHQTLGMSFRTFWGRGEKFLVAGEQEIIHTKPFFFPVVYAATFIDHHLEVDQSLVSTPAWVVSTLPLQDIACFGSVHYIMSI
ncbi:hypothetical protein Taro_031100 [Colocasia esculenta]|uniref:Uncharacterized protein n=1 Tax=Colocasia esculenta TaxID=4460 RepID=A0A843VZV9_COLES|nr:hypothetical protein [Colocasia esculenta]